jgi:hypothetical protein
MNSKSSLIYEGKHIKSWSLFLLKPNNEFDVLLSGRNPSKTNLSLGKPLLTKAGTNAVAPGKHFNPFSTQARVNKTRIWYRWCSRIRNQSYFPALISKWDSRQFCVVHVMAVHVCQFLKCFNSFPLVRVSSARIKSTFKNWMARKVMSSRLPMGVGTIYNFDIAEII